MASTTHRPHAVTLQWCPTGRPLEGQPGPVMLLLANADGTTYGYGYGPGRSMSFGHAGGDIDVEPRQWITRYADDHIEVTDHRPEGAEDATHRNALATWIDPHAFEVWPVPRPDVQATAVAEAYRKADTILTSEWLAADRAAATETAVAAVRDLHYAENDGPGLGDYCAACTALGMEVVPYPCPTIQALPQPTPVTHSH